MASLMSPREDAWRSLFHSFKPEPRPELLNAVAAPEAELKSRPKPFSFFRNSDLSQAQELARELNELAGPKRSPGDEALARVMRRFHEVAAENVPLAQWGLRLFIASRPGAQILPMPTLREQLAVHRKERPDLFESKLALAPAALTPPAAGSEDLIAYYRHDLDLSDHHLHWHILYPFSGDQNRPKLKGLQGRLFLFMHQQMLARYNTERFAAGLPLVEPFFDWRNSKSWSAAFKRTDLPRDALAPWIGPAWIKSGSPYIAFDEKGTAPAKNDPADLTTVVNGLKLITKKLKARGYKSYDALGVDLEASSTDPRLAFGPHNNGHMVLATPPPDPQNPQPQAYFVMANPEVAMTTPIFYRWHRAIDDMGFAWQEAQGPDTTHYAATPITVRKGAGAAATKSPDVILTPRSAIPGIENKGFDLDEWAETQFGGAAFRADPTPSLNVDELVTELRPDPAIPGVQVLSIKTDWVYVLRLSNPANSPASVTVRIWLAATALASDRRNWMEMDKFVATVPANGEKVVARGSWQSSVVRAKSVSDPMMLADTGDTFNDKPADDESLWCECGLPYRLLLPRGTSAGMPARFLVLFTDAAEDNTLAQLSGAQCGSVTFCAKQDDVWPDTKEMGFPFHRPFASAPDPVRAHFDALPGAVWRDVTIRAT